MIALIGWVLIVVGACLHFIPKLSRLKAAVKHEKLEPQAGEEPKI